MDQSLWKCRQAEAVSVCLSSVDNVDYNDDDNDDHNVDNDHNDDDNDDDTDDHNDDDDNDSKTLSVSAFHLSTTW